MAGGGTAPGVENRLIYSIQHTYIIKPVYKSENTMPKHILKSASKPEITILTCNQRIDIPTIEPLLPMTALVYPDQPSTVVPCIELAGEFLSEFNLTFETNEGVTVLPLRIPGALEALLDNPYLYDRYVLVLPRGATGVKSCKLIHKVTGKEVQHNFTFGIMPPPYNYDNALFSYLSYRAIDNSERIYALRLTTETPDFASNDLPKGAGKQTIDIVTGALFYKTEFNYPISPEPTIHKPKITLHDDDRDFVYTLSLNKTTNTVSIDLFTGMLTVYDGVTGEITQQFKLATPRPLFYRLSFEDFDDIKDPVLRVTPRGARVT